MKLAEDALKGSILAGARLIRLLEENDPQGIEGLKLLYPNAGRAYLIGITGPPGAGKSTLVDRIIAEFRAEGKKVGVIAIDPSSPYSGGAILGDRVRMQRHATDDGVFVRSMATRGHLGGLSKATFEATLVLDAMGYDVILVETVGVGQDEVEIVDLAHTTAVVSLPGMGDDIQAMKAGILEIGDIFIVNKADRIGADEVVKQLTVMVEMRDHKPGDWIPPVVKTVASKTEGITDLVGHFLRHRQHLLDTGALARRIEERELHFFKEILKEKAYELIRSSAASEDKYAALIEAIKGRKSDPYTAAEELLKGFTIKF